MIVIPKSKAEYIIDLNDQWRKFKDLRNDHKFDKNHEHPDFLTVIRREQMLDELLGIILISVKQR